MDLTLYDCLEVEKAIEAVIETNEGEITDDQLKELVAAQTQTLAKIENFCQWFKRVEAFENFCKTEEKRIADHRKVAVNRAERMKKFLLAVIQEKGGKVQAGTFTLSARKSPPAVEIDPEFHNDLYIRVKEILEVDKEAIKEDLKKGTEIPGAKLTQHYYLKIG